MSQKQESMDWNCAACSFLNHNTSNQCSICYTIKSNGNKNNNNYINSNMDCNDYYDEYSYYDQQSEYNKYDDFEWDSTNQKLTKFTFSIDKKKKTKKYKKNKIIAVIALSNDANDEKKQQKKHENEKCTKQCAINIENMNYKQYTRNVCKWYIRWSNKQKQIFPDYRDISGSIVSQKRINTAKKIVALLLKQESKKIIKAWKQFTSKRYYGKQMLLKVDIDNAIKRVNSTRIQQDDDETYGEADEDSIWITECQLSDEGLVGTILHEALHFMATLNGKEICEKDEHFVIKMLGDDEC